MSSITLSPDQRSALDHIRQWLDTDEQELTLGGYAGTGKTTLLKEVREESELNMKLCAFTGKAASVLRTKGLAASTIHSLIYDVFRNPDGTLDCSLKDPAEIPGDMFVVDEASMVSTDIYKDLCSVGRKILWVGDHGQLEPVGDNPNLMANPTVRLEKIHRQAADNPIIQLAHTLREGNNLIQAAKMLPGDERCRLHFKHMTQLGDVIDCAFQGCEDPQKMPQIIVAYNSTRTNLNALIRDAIGFPSDQPTLGDKVICLRNNRELQIYNGEIGYITAIEPVKNGAYESNYEIAVDFGDREVNEILVAGKQFGEQKTMQKIPARLNLFDYAYAVTCHKAQGSEFHHVVVIDAACDLWSPSRWSYTAATRAADRLDYFQ